MSALPLSIPDLSIPDLEIPDVSAPETYQGPPTRRVAGAGRISRSSTTPVKRQLTDRGIAVVMVILALIMTAALTVIGLTALRVTSGDYVSRPTEPVQTHR